MATFTIKHEINCNEETFWKLFFDKEFNERLYLDGLGFPSWSVLEQTETDTEWRRKTKGSPKLQGLPGPVMKLIGDGFNYVETGSMSKKDKVWKWSLKPSALTDKLKQEGSLRIEKIGDDKIRRVVDLVVEAKVFGIGGMIESAVEKSLREGWDASGAFMNKWIADKK